MTIEQILEIIERYKLRIPPTVYYELLADIRNEQEPTSYQWCTDCKEYDHEKHCCHRWSNVIRNTVEEMKQEPKTGHWIKIKPYPLQMHNYECSECGHETDDNTENYCSECGAKMESEG